MTAKEFFDAGKLDDAVARLGEDVRANPGDQRSRVFLFELLCFAGDLQRAQKQLDAVAADDVDAELGVARYRNLLSAEANRREVLAGRASPRFPGTIPPYASLHHNAARMIHDGKEDAAVVLLEEAMTLRAVARGTINGEAFEDFSDCDDLLAPFLEATVQGEYCWIPWENIKSVAVAEPKYLRDLCWIPAHLEFNEGTAGETFLHVLYVSSYLHPDPLVRLGRRTDWRTEFSRLSLGVGQKVFAAGDVDRPILEIRDLEFDHANAADTSG